MFVLLEDGDLFGRGLKDVSSLSVPSAESWHRRFWHRIVYCALEVMWISKGGCEVCLAIRFHSQCCARVSVVSVFWCTKVCLQAHWVGLVLGFWFCWDPTKVFVFVEDRNVRMGHTKKCVHVLQAFFDIGSTNAMIDVPEVLMNESQIVNLCQQHQCTDVEQACFCIVVWCFVEGVRAFRHAFRKWSSVIWQVGHLHSSDNCLTEDMLSVWCSCLVGQSGVFQWRGVFINGKQTNTIGLIAAWLSMVEAVSCTYVSRQVETALCQRLTVWWLCTSPWCYNCCGKSKGIIPSRQK